MKLKIFLSLAVLLCSQYSFAQPDPCDTGSEAACECETAEILCSINELDGYSFSMSDFQHPDDGPDPLCDGNGVPNNPTWFSFIAWCEELEITVSLSNCTIINPPGPFNTTFGAQVGIYESCNYEEVICSSDDCGNEDDKVLDADGLTIGATYYFMIDGCLGSACDVDISVVGSCSEVIEDWDTGLTGPTEACSGEEIEYEAEDIDGAIQYHWFIDGVEDAITDTEEHTITWGAEGTYELCVDASNDCVDVDEEPAEYCITVTVIEPDAGTITATPNPLCPGETSDFEVTGFNMDAEIEEAIIVVDPNGEVIEVITNGNSGSVTYDECGDVTIYSLNYADYEALTIPSVGESYSGTDCADLCCEEESLVISFEDDEDPEFTNPPADLTLICYDLLPPMEDLDVTDNCAPDGLVSGTETGSADICDGGTIEREWSFSDNCGNEVTYIQTITIDPQPLIDFVNPPGDEDIVCSGSVPPPIDLMYTNNGIGGCLVEGLVSPTVNGQFNVCGSTITYEWDFTDACGNNINHVQTIEVLPAEEPDFINPPSDVVLDCDETIPDPIDLDYSNNDQLVCLDEGVISPIVNGSFDPCGTIITYEWDYTDPCGININHVQTIEVLPAIEAAFINPPADMTLTCDEYDVFTFDDLDYTNGQSDMCEISGTESPVITDNTDTCGGEIEAEYTFEDDCGRVIEHVQTITVDPPPPAVFLSMPADITVSCSSIPDDADPLDYSNSEGGVCLIEGVADPTIEEDLDACGGTITNTWEYTDDCNRTIEYVQVITIDPAAAPEFESFPSGMTLTCEEFTLFTPETLTYTNNESGACLNEGEVDPTSSGVITECGGTIVYEWEFTDMCGQTIFHNQIINVNPAPEAEFVTSPPDITVDCSEVNEDLPFLEYDNEASGSCIIQGFVEAIPSGAINECGGTLVYTWTFVDNCGRLITEDQNVTFTPAEEPEWIDPPEDITLDCDEDFPEAELLEYDNDADEPCEINGEVEAVIFDDDNIYTYTWTFTNPCTDNVIEHVQIVEKRLPVEFEEDEFEFQICVGVEFDLSTLDIIDINDTDPEITFHDEFPPDDSNEIDPIVILEEDNQEFYILGNNEYDCFDVATIIGIGDEVSEAGEDVEDEFCIGNELLDLYSFLEFDADLDGEFTLIDGPDLDFAFADEINVSNAEPGFYTFEYFVESDNSCPSDESEMIIELLPPIEIELISIACNPDGQTYTVVISNDNYDIDISGGTITSETSSEVTIDNIPITEDLEVEAEDNGTRCEAEFIFSHPDCSCPAVDAPSIVSNISLCEGEVIPLLEVTVNVDVTANWYDAPTGGTLLIANSLSYQATNNLPGIYTFYVEGESTVQAGCLSATRTPIQLEIIPQPNVTSITIDLCDTNENGLATIEQSEIESMLLTNSQSLNVMYFLNEMDLMNNVNPIAFPFTTTEVDSQTIYFSASNSASCTTTGNIVLNTNPLPIITLLKNDETCIGAGDGFIDIEVNTTNPPHQLVYNGDTLSTNLIENLTPGLYEIEAIDANGCSNTSSVNIESGLELFFETLEVTCNDNNTSSDESDDFYVINFNVQNTDNTIGNYNILFNPQGISNDYEYGQLYTVEIPADNAMTIAVVNDLLLNCNIQQDIGELTPCSSDCEITINTLDYFCQDNGTPQNPDDDYYDFTINVSSINGSANNTYNVLVDNVPSFSFMYDQTSTFILPANGTSANIRVADSQNVNCFASEITTLLEPCSDECSIIANQTSAMCSDNGTIETEEDDLFSYSIFVGAINGSDSFVIDGLTQTYSYDESITFDNILISNGSFEITITDVNKTDCTTILTITPPPPCSEPCSTSLSAFAISECNDNNTELDPSDDFFNVDLTVTSSDGIVTNVLITDNLGNNYGPFNYNENISLGPFNSDGSDITITITDETNGTCLIQETFSQTSCSSSCELTAEIVSIACNDNGTSASNDDDTFELTFSVSSVNGGNQFNTNLGPGGNYEDEITISNLLISDGTITLEITDDLTLDCMTTLEVIPPLPCSSPCLLDFSYFDILQCDDNSTNSDDTDDFYAVGLNVIAIDGIVSNFIINDSDGNSYGPFEYNTDIELGPFDANGNVITLSFSDTQNPNCSIVQDISQSSCSSACTIEGQIVDILCNDNNTQGTNEDDIFTASITVNGLNISSEFGIEGLTDTYSYNEEIEIGPFTISGGNQVITLFDLDGGITDCSTVLTLIPPAPCSDPCDIELQSLVIGDCNDNGTGNTDDDDFYNLTVNILGVFGNGNQYFLRDNLGNNYGPFVYNVDSEVGPLSANGEELTFTVFDQFNGSCITTFSSMNSPCSECTNTIAIIAPVTIIDCVNTSLTLEVDGNIPDIQSLEWTGPNLTSTQMEIEISEAGTYSLIATFTNGCTATDEIVVTIDDETPIADAGEDGVINCDVSLFTLDGSQSNVTANTLIEWMDQDGNVISNALSVEVMMPGTFTLQLTDTLTNCTSNVDIVEVMLFDNTPSAIIFADPGNVLDCFIESIDLSTQQEENVIYNWIIDNQVLNDPIITLTEAFSVSLIALDTLSQCDTESTLLLEDLTAFPLIAINDFENIGCANEETCISITTLPSSQPYQYIWYDEFGNTVFEGDSIFCTNMPGTYTVELSDITNGCINESTFEIEGSLMPMIQLPFDIDLSIDDSYQLQPTVNLSDDEIATIEWVTDVELSCYDCLNPFILNFEDNDVITLIINSINGCEDIVETRVNLVEEPITAEYYIPNVFSTDFDNRFTIYTNDQIEIIESVHIYDRWGELIFINENFAPNDASIGWDGTFNDRYVEQGVYVYMFKFMANGRLEIATGDITFLK